MFKWVKRVGLATLCGALAVCGRSFADDWPAYRHDSGNSAASAEAPPLPPFVRAWSQATGFFVESSPAVAGGKLYCGSHDHRLYALDLATGEEVWRFSAGLNIYSSPAVAGDLVYFGSYDGSVYALHSDDGSLAWQFETGGWVKSSPTVAEALVFIGSDDRKVYALRAATGEPAWEFTTADQVDTTVALGGGTVFVVSDRLHALDALTGSPLWSFGGEFSWSSRTSPLTDDTAVYFGAGRAIHAVDQVSGDALWETPIGFGYTAAGEAALANGLLFVTVSRFLEGPEIWVGALVALDVATGEPRWLLIPDERQSRISAPPSVAGSVLYFATQGGGFYAVHAPSGQVIWRQNPGLTSNTSLVISDGRLYFGAMDYKIYAVEGTLYDVADRK